MSREPTPQIAVPAVYMRGGTSRAIIFHAADLPADPAARDAIFLAALGSPDPNRRQLDGLGGAISSLSKIAIVGPSSRPDADVDYTFGQVAIDAPLVQYKGNCGNISSAIGPFALDEGLVAADGDSATVRIHNTNTGKIIVSRFPVSGGQAAVDGDFELQGVAGRGAPIRLSFLEPGGAATGRLLPTGRVRDDLLVEGLGTLSVSMVDAANPVVFVDARSLDMTGTELPDEIEARPGLLARLEAIRAAAAVAMGIAATEAEARTRIRNLPQVGILAAPVDTPTLSGKVLSASSFHILARMISAGQPHKASPLTGAMCLAIAMRLPGTIAAELARLPSDPDADLIVAHPSGLLPVAARLREDGAPHAEEAVVYRTARRLMQGSVLVPRKLLEALENVSTGN
ncbi:2-methylaconitate cis-trans isomerase PrpF family protein [Ancylobacter oerskovii]|uniref:2-methylaconitate cis-trans isomerase PrpF family protein n=1 Tax=Ancylobacter oerskovii TaxID=459519 RepID=A0ABW4Z0V2_9HYPH|nr:PrpF domain-containing protein [Ancylobacter oerskovii]MBS7542809.1 PrpF family protein [Ancylobacter oerskovii]